MSNHSKFFVLFSCCIPVKGAVRSLIIDTQRNNFYFIPNTLYDLFDNGIINCDQTFHKFANDDIQNLHDYFNYLIKNELGFYSNAPELYPRLSTEFEEPRIFANSIVDVSSEYAYDIVSVIQILDFFGVESIQFRVFSCENYEIVKDILKEVLQTKRLRTIEMLIPYQSKGLEELIQEAANCMLLSHLIIHGNPFEETIFNSKGVVVEFIKVKVESEQVCGCISPKHFRTDIRSVTENINYNSCLYKKISVDKFGNLKNCPAMPNSFGSVSISNIQSLVLSSKFQEVGKLKKDQFLVCKDCEFRYVCSDCRVFLEDENNILSKPSKCGYNPYTTKWN